MRSLFKLAFSDFFYAFIKNYDYTEAKTFYSRRSTITSFLLGVRVRVHSGASIFTFLVRDIHLNHKFGEFVMTKRMGPAIHLVNKGSGKEKKVKGKKTK